MHEHGTRIVSQLFHGGREMITSGPRPPAVSASSIPSARFLTEPRALSLAEIDEMVAGYRQAAVHAREGGLDGVEVCAGFGYLPTQFLSKHANSRTDALRRLVRKPAAVPARGAEAMREGIGPGGAVGCRLTDESGSFDGTDWDDVIEAAGVVADAGLADYISVALGGSSTYRGSTWIVPPPPAGPKRDRRLRAAGSSRASVCP